MYLSEAMAMGSLQSDQAFGTLVDGEGNRCAWGGAYQAIGVEIVTMKQTCCDPWTDVTLTHSIEIPQSDPLAWGWAFTKKASCPECAERHSVAETSAHLNDAHKWTRPRIADWVRAQEIRFGIRKEEDATVSPQRSEAEHQGVLVHDVC